MSEFQWGQFGGAIVPCLIITMILYAATGGWPKSIGKIVFISIMAAILQVLLYAVGSSISAQAAPRLAGAQFYLFWQFVIGIVDYFRFRRTKPKAIDIERAEPKF